MENVEKEVKKFRKKTKLPKDPCADDIVKALSLCGYVAKGYKDNENLLKQTNNYELSKTKPAFSYHSKKHNIVFYNDKLNDNDIAYVLSHEAGHICGNHLRSYKGIFDTEVSREREANEFAYLLLKDNKKFKIFLSITLVFIFTASLIIASSLKIINTKDSVLKTNLISNNITKEGTAYVIIGEDIYHKRDCPKLYNQTNIAEIDILNAQGLNYKPCDFCFGNQ